MKKALVTGAGGFIGHHMEKYLKAKGYFVRGVDIKKPEFESSQSDQFYILDLRGYKNCLKASKGIDEVYNFAANMGGVGYLETVHAEIMHDNVLINANMLEASLKNKIKKFFFASSACVYPKYLQAKPEVKGLTEDLAYPADCDNEYGWEKLFTERMCFNYWQDYGLETRVARFHNVYGPLGTYEGGREKSPAAFCRKIALAKDGDTIDVWGDGKQTRSYTYINDCLKGVYRLTQSDITKPLNIGSDQMVTINQLIKIISSIAEKKIKTKHDLSKPQGVRGRNSDNTLIKRLLNWTPQTKLEQGLKTTYKWIKKQVL
jgi:GDP-D-mannose 3', 5'-epimerase